MNAVWKPELTYWSGRVIIAPPMLDGLQYHLLRRTYDGNSGPLTGGAYQSRSKLESLFGRQIWDQFRDKTVIDFGCGVGKEAIEIAKNGARKVIGLDIQPQYLKEGRLRAAGAGVSDVCDFVTRCHSRADVIVSVDSFEHFDDPAAILTSMAELLEPSGTVFVSFGPTWYHPYGGHLFSVFPWAHLIFSEKALIRWRSDFKSDGASCFREVAGGLNQMTIGRFKRLVGDSPLRFERFEPVPIRATRFLHNRMTREFLTSVVRCELRHR